MSELDCMRQERYAALARVAQLEELNEGLKTALRSTSDMLEARSRATLKIEGQLARNGELLR